MKIWYKAVCDEHKEFMDIFVNNPTCTSSYLSENDKKIQKWLLEDHYACDLRLIHRDGELDQIFENHYVDAAKKK